MVRWGIAPQQPELLVYPTASLAVEPEMLVLPGPIAKPEYVGSASFADQIEDGDLFGKANGVVERQDDDERQHQLFRACGDGTGELARGREIPIRRTVMLAEHRGPRIPRLGSFARVDGGLVQLFRRSAKVGSSHVETHLIHNRYLTSLSVGG
jgi:hypothetical protein